jgi:hypothetical protein
MAMEAKPMIHVHGLTVPGAVGLSR